MPLTKKQQKHLYQLAHKLKPVIWLGQHGLTENFLAELDAVLNHHELIKAKLRVGDRALRDKLIEDICEKTGADFVQRTGNIAIIFRKNNDNSSINLPTN